MLKLTLAFALLCAAASPGAFSDPVTHKFEAWGKFSDAERLIFLYGFTNGFVAWGPTDLAAPLGKCMGHMSGPQAVAMIDKYYRDHPERWDVPIAVELVHALAVKGGPCEAYGIVVPQEAR
jgi:hypothetical protein